MVDSRENYKFDLWSYIVSKTFTWSDEVLVVVLDTGPKRSWVLIDTARDCSHTYCFEVVFFLREKGVREKNCSVYSKKTCDYD